MSDGFTDKDRFARLTPSEQIMVVVTWAMLVGLVLFSAALILSHP